MLSSATTILGLLNEFLPGNRGHLCLCRGKGFTGNKLSQKTMQSKTLVSLPSGNEGWRDGVFRLIHGQMFGRMNDNFAPSLGDDARARPSF